ncbi:RICIN domain-containing protein [Streptomyces sp. NPDC048825]|uniref:RICIN domain-containing protein n=1 Tax=Streptomyces sp. NPDC048825 TaxID=3365592 RepID=UPI0037141357
MPNLTRSIRNAAVLAATIACTMLATAPQAASVEPHIDMVNRMDGSRLALLNDSTGEEAQAITLRDPQYKYKTEQWESNFTKDSQGNWYGTVRNEAADKCLQPSDPQPQRGGTIVVKTCNGSDDQLWLATPDTDGGTNWWQYRPKTDESLAMTLKSYVGPGAWDHLYLDTAYKYPSADRLWKFEPNS